MGGHRHVAGPALRSSLVGALAADRQGLDVWRTVEPKALLEAALEHAVAPALHVALREEPDVPPELAKPLAQVHAHQLFRHMRTMSETAQVAQLLDAAGIAWVVVKGPVLAEVFWPRPDLRMYSDLDLLVDPRRFGDAIDVLEDAGAELVDRNWPMIRSQLRGELTIRLPHGTVADLHWDVVNDARLRPIFRLPSADILSRSRRVLLGQHGGLEAPTLDPVDTVLHLAYHTVHSGAHKLVWFKDIHLALASAELDEHELWRRARRTGCDVVLAVAVRRAESLFGPVLQVRRRPRPVWSTVTALTDRLRPVPAPAGQRFSGQIVFANTRQSSLASAIATVRDTTRPRPPRDWAASNPLHRDVPDARARADYLRLVRGAGPLDLAGAGGRP